MLIEVKMFALAKDLAGGPTVTLELPDEATVADLRRALAETVAELAPLLPRMMIAVGGEFAADDQVLQPNHEVACLPPVSGGVA